jgi:hypothetical protein
MALDLVSFFAWIGFIISFHLCGGLFFGMFYDLQLE